MTADRPATEPRTEAGRRMLHRRSYWSGNNAIREAILAIEAEAAQGAAPLDVQLTATCEWCGEQIVHSGIWTSNIGGDYCPEGQDVGPTGTSPHKPEGAAPRAEGHTVRYVDAGRDEPPENGYWRCSCGKSFAPDGVDEYASHLAASRAEGLDVERLADLEHEQWAHWTRYMLDNLTPENIERWRRQINTPYADLSEKEKESDREWARKVLARLSRPSDERVPESEEPR